MLKLREKAGPPGYLEVEEPPGSGKWVDYRPGSHDSNRSSPRESIQEAERMGKQVYRGIDHYGAFYRDANNKPITAKEAEDLHNRLERRIRKHVGLPEVDQPSKSDVAKAATYLRENVDESVLKSPLFRRALKLFPGDVEAAVRFVKAGHRGAGGGYEG